MNLKNIVRISFQEVDAVTSGFAGYLIKTEASPFYELGIVLGAVSQIGGAIHEGVTVNNYKKILNEHKGPKATLDLMVFTGGRLVRNLMCSAGMYYSLPELIPFVGLTEGFRLYGHEKLHRRANNKKT